MYIAFKILHVFAVVVFLGNLITGILWKVSADQTRNPVIIHHTAAGLIRADRWFTIPSVLLILIGGFGAAVVGGLPLVRTRWILAGIILFTISGVSYMARVVPIQSRIAGRRPGGSGLRVARLEGVRRAHTKLERVGYDRACRPASRPGGDDRQALAPWGVRACCSFLDLQTRSRA